MPLKTFRPLQKMFASSWFRVLIAHTWQPGWLSGLALPSAQDLILETWIESHIGLPCMEPASPSVCVSASLSSLMNE